MSILIIVNRVARNLLQQRQYVYIMNSNAVITLHVYIQIGYAMVQKIVRMVLMNHLLIVKILRADQINFNVKIRLVYPVIIYVLVTLNVPMVAMKQIVVSYI